MYPHLMYLHPGRTCMASVSVTVLMILPARKKQATFYYSLYGKEFQSRIRRRRRKFVCAAD